MNGFRRWGDYVSLALVILAAALLVQNVMHASKIAEVSKSQYNLQKQMAAVGAGTAELEIDYSLLIDRINVLEQRYAREVDRKLRALEEKTKTLEMRTRELRDLVREIKVNRPNLQETEE